MNDLNPLLQICPSMMFNWIKGNSTIDKQNKKPYKKIHAVVISYSEIWVSLLVWKNHIYQTLSLTKKKNTLINIWFSHWLIISPFVTCIVHSITWKQKYWVSDPESYHAKQSYFLSECSMSEHGYFKMTCRYLENSCLH